MKTVRDACELQPNAISIKLNHQIEQLDELITSEGDWREFFKKTFITHDMKDLVGEGIRPDEAKEATVLRELVKNHRIG